MSAPESYEGRLVSATLAEPVSGRSVAHSGPHGGMASDREGQSGGPERSVDARTALGASTAGPEPSGGRLDGYGDEKLGAGLGRILAEIDGLPPKVEARPRFDDGLPCCDLHSPTCEPKDLCCRDCVEATHPHHTDGSDCMHDAVPGKVRAMARDWTQAKHTQTGGNRP